MSAPLGRARYLTPLRRFVSVQEHCPSIVIVYHHCRPVRRTTWGETMTDFRTVAFAVAALAAVPAAAALPQASATMAMPKGDAAAGAKTFAQCKACHVTTAGVNRIGPSLHAVVGRKAGSVPGYPYSVRTKTTGSGGR